MGTVPRACTGKPKASQASTSRAAPSTTTPDTPCSLAPSARISPQQLLCRSPRLSITMTSPGWLCAMASMPKCARAGTAPAAVILMVTARPTTLVRPQRGVMPATAQRAMPRESSASLKLEVANAFKRSRNWVSNSEAFIMSLFGLQWLIGMERKQGVALSGRWPALASRASFRSPAGSSATRTSHAAAARKGRRVPALAPPRSASAGWPGLAAQGKPDRRAPRGSPDSPRQADQDSSSPPPECRPPDGRDFRAPP